jgi:tRNA(Arg) A34 adenosine deaminase TadA/8-oxo-dGTP pyrophosphatase MutT (NUDIX family)
VKPLINKVVAYITRKQPGTLVDQLLVFRHTQYPDAGIQVPAGTIKPGEDPLFGALREVYEESGLENLVLVSFLGTRDFDCTPYGINQIHHRFFYHFEAADDLPENWLHLETDPSDHEALSYEFEFSWAALPGSVPALTGEQDAMLDSLLESIGHARYIRRCYDLALAALHKGNHPFGALLVHQGEVLLAAENTVSSEQDVTRHAEMNLVSLAARTFSREELAGCMLYTSTEPCVMCSGAIYWSGIQQVVFGAAAQSLATMAGERFVLSSREVFGEGRSQVHVLGPILEEEGLQVLRQW